MRDFTYDATVPDRMRCKRYCIELLAPAGVWMCAIKIWGPIRRIGLDHLHIKSNLGQLKFLARCAT